ncbi:MAG: hypothetical protein U0Z53_00665 [Blastocatellia bacterium]
MKRFLSRISIGLLTCGLAGLIAWTSLAAVRPFHLVEHGTLTVVNGHLVADGAGTATFLGRFTLHREATLTPMGSDLKVSDGKATLTAANGDQLEASFTGTIFTATGQGVLTYEWTGGTGQFQNASGPTIWQVELHPDQGTYDLTACGVINF